MLKTGVGHGGGGKGGEKPARKSILPVNRVAIPRIQASALLGMLRVPQEMGFLVRTDLAQAAGLGSFGTRGMATCSSIFLVFADGDHRWVYYSHDDTPGPTRPTIVALIAYARNRGWNLVAAASVHPTPYVCRDDYLALTGGLLGNNALNDIPVAQGDWTCNFNLLAPPVAVIDNNAIDLATEVRKLALARGAMVSVNSPSFSIAWPGG